MVAITLILLVVIAPIGAAVVIRQFMDLHASKCATANLETDLTAAILRAGTPEVLSVCDRYPDRPLTRVAKLVLGRSPQVSGSPAIRYDLLRLLFRQALAREIEGTARTLALLRTMSLICAPIGMMALVWDLASSILSYKSFFDWDRPFPMVIAEALPCAIGGLMLSMVALISYKQLKTRISREHQTLEACSEMLCAFLVSPAARTAAEPHPGEAEIADLHTEETENASPGTSLLHWSRMSLSPQPEQQEGSQNR